MKVLCVRISCQKEKYHWYKLRKHKKDQVIICGDPDLNRNYKLDDDVLYLRCGDGYDALPEKMIAAFNAILDIKEFDQYDRFLKLDFDNGIRNSCNFDNYDDIKRYDYVGQKIFNLTKENPRDYHFSRVDKSSYWYQRRYEGPMVPYADGGCSYILSRRALELITNQYGFDSLDKIRKFHVYEDMMIGVLLNHHNITPHKCYYYVAGDKKIHRVP